MEISGCNLYSCIVSTSTHMDFVLFVSRVHRARYLCVGGYLCQLRSVSNEKTGNPYVCLKPALPEMSGHGLNLPPSVLFPIILHVPGANVLLPLGASRRPGTWSQQTPKLQFSNWKFVLQDQCWLTIVAVISADF